ncbi:MAG: serine/threonine protein kinase [Candidatus Brocadiae bacterium]|nr:serine/threonine protein kinase [Candidatus Brocadiia bacterium]
MNENEILSYCIQKKYITAAQAKGLFLQYHKLENPKDFFSFIGEQLSWKQDAIEKERQDLMAFCSMKIQEFQNKLIDLIRAEKIDASQASLMELLFQKGKIDSGFLKTFQNGPIQNSVFQNAQKTFLEEKDKPREEDPDRTADNLDGEATMDDPDLHIKMGEKEIKQIDCYKIEKKLGSGGAGEVYKGIDSETGEVVAIKMLQIKPGKESSAAFKRFSQEIKVHLQLSHPNIVQFIKWGIQNESPYIVMEFVDGISLDKLIASTGKLPARRALSLILPVVSALDYALANKIIHRDIKPANIIADLKRGKVKLADMGLGKMIETSGITLSQEIMGTPKYMAPEQITTFSKVDYRADIYALGATLYHILAGKPPFDDKNLFNVMRLKMSEMPMPLEQLVPDLPVPLVHFVNKMMAINQEERYQSYKEIQESMQGILEDLK